MLRPRNAPLLTLPTRPTSTVTANWFDMAVDEATEKIQLMRDHGYRFGLILAWGLTGSDFDALDDPGVRGEIQEIVHWWDQYSGDLFSDEFCQYVGMTLADLRKDGAVPRKELEEILGGEHHPQVGVRWEGSLPILSETFTDSLVAALLDVRDEAVRRLNVPPSTDGEARISDGEEQ